MDTRCKQRPSASSSSDRSPEPPQTTWCCVGALRLVKTSLSDNRLDGGYGKCGCVFPGTSNYGIRFPGKCLLPACRAPELSVTGLLVKPAWAAVRVSVTVSGWINTVAESRKEQWSRCTDRWTEMDWQEQYVICINIKMHYLQAIL